MPTIGIFSRVPASSFDGLAEVPVIGTISSAVRLPVCGLYFLYHVISYPFSSKNAAPKKIDSIKASVICFGKALAEIIPIIGNVVACHLNKKDNIDQNKKFVRGLNEDILGRLIDDYRQKLSMNQQMTPLQLQVREFAIEESQRRTDELESLVKMNEDELSLEKTNLTKNDDFTWFTNHKLSLINFKLFEMNRKKSVQK